MATVVNFDERCRELPACRLVVLSLNSIQNAQTTVTGVRGIRHLLWHPNTAGAGQVGVRLTGPDNGTVTWDVESGVKQGRLYIYHRG